MKDKILARYVRDPRSFIEQMGIYNLKYGSRQAIGCCPMHDDHNPSFSINFETGLWQCFSGCGAGDLFSLYKQVTSFVGDFYEQLKEMERL
jgi:DNA primase